MTRGAMILVEIPSGIGTEDANMIANSIAATLHERFQKTGRARFEVIPVQDRLQKDDRTSMDAIRRAAATVLAPKPAEPVSAFLPPMGAPFDPTKPDRPVVRTKPVVTRGEHLPPLPTEADGTRLGRDGRRLPPKVFHQGIIVDGVHYGYSVAEWNFLRALAAQDGATITGADLYRILFPERASMATSASAINYISHTGMQVRRRHPEITPLTSARGRTNGGYRWTCLDAVFYGSER
jgi:hypothetical protein